MQIVLAQDVGKIVEGAKEFGPNMYLVVLVFLASAVFVWRILSWLKARDEKDQQVKVARDEREQQRMDRIVTHMEEQGKISIEQGKAIIAIASMLQNMDDDVINRRRRKKRRMEDE